MNFADLFARTFLSSGKSGFMQLEAEGILKVMQRIGKRKADHAALDVFEGSPAVREALKKQLAAENLAFGAGEPDAKAYQRALARLSFSPKLAARR